MARSYHATFSQLKGKTKGQLDEMTKDLDSTLNELVTKTRTKKEVKTERKELEVRKGLLGNKDI